MTHDEMAAELRAAGYYVEAPPTDDEPQFALTAEDGTQVPISREAFAIIAKLAGQAEAEAEVAKFMQERQDSIRRGARRTSHRFKI